VVFVTAEAESNAADKLFVLMKLHIKDIKQDVKEIKEEVKEVLEILKELHFASLASVASARD